MRRIVLVSFIIALCGQASAAGVAVDSGKTFGLLGAAEQPPGGMNSPPPFGFQTPLPGGVEGSLPRVDGQPDSGVNINDPGINAFPELPGLSGLASIELEVELPGLDGLPIRPHARAAATGPAMPGFDGLPLGGSRQ